MIVVISPSKTLDFSSEINDGYTNPEFLEETFKLIIALRKLTKIEILKLMNLSENLTILNYQRYHNFSLPFTLDNARQAIYAFKGDVYHGLAVNNFHQENIQYAQLHLRIISGLYGLLRPLDLIQAYRLEMGTKLVNQKGKDLYAYWGDTLTVKLNEVLQSEDNDILVNLASTEYFKVINKKLLQASLITPVFKEKKGDSLKVVALFAKRARGMMASYIIKNRIKTTEDLKQFNEDGYIFNKAASNEDQLVFVRTTLTSCINNSER